MFPTGSFAPIFLLAAAAGHVALALLVGGAALGVGWLLRTDAFRWRRGLLVAAIAAVPGLVGAAVAALAALFGPKMGAEAVRMEHVAYASMFLVPLVGMVVGAGGVARLRSP